MLQLYQITAALLLTISGTGVVRYVTGLGVTASLVCTLLSVALLVLLVLFKAPRTPSRPPDILATILLTLVWGALLFVCIYTKAPGGVFSTGGADNASHLGLVGEFSYHSNKVYNGFVIFVGFVSALSHVFHSNVIDALSIAIYSNLLLCLTLLAIAAYQTARYTTHSSILRLIISLLPTIGFIAVFNPLVYYNIGEGFWPHITSIVVLAALWAGLVCLPSASARIALILASLVLYRFFYGLNLADLCITSSMLVLYEARYFKRPFNIVVGLIGIGLLGAGVYAYSQLVPLAELSGGIRPHARAINLSMAALASVISLASWLFAQRFNRAITFQLFAFPFIFSLVSVGAEWIYDLNQLPERYYIFKYGLHRTLLLSIALPLTAGATLLTALPAIRRSLITASVSLVFFLAATLASYQVYNSYASYRTDLGLFLTSHGRRRMPELLFSKVLASSIQDVLEKEQKPYVATLGTQFPSIPFLNTYMTFASQGHSAIFSALAIMDNGIPSSSAGCVFWLKNGPFHTTPLYFPNIQHSIQAFDALPSKQCLKRIDERRRPFKICYVCR